MIRFLSVLLGVLGLIALSPAGATAHSGSGLPPIRHVWVIELENHSFDEAFSPDHQLGGPLARRGQVLRQYYGTGHASLDNYIAQISGQAPNADTQGDCQLYTDVLPGLPAGDGQVLGQGCVYPRFVRTLADQLEEQRFTWKGYMEDMGNDPAREPATCGNPALNTQDKTQGATQTDQYAARHNPFVYFHSILDVPGRCAAHVVSLAPLAGDLANSKRTPNFSWITPNLCNDGHDATPCQGLNAKGTNDGGIDGIDAFLSTWVPRITSSQAFKRDGLLLITFDESETQDGEACCNEPAGFNTPMPGIFGPGGGRTGALAISPFVRAGTVNDTPYNHYAMLKSLEQAFGIPEHLGYAGMPGLQAFGADVYNARR